MVAITALTFTACSKSNEKQIVGTWKVIKVMQGSKDVTADWTKSPYKEVYGSDGNYSYSGQPGNTISGAGKYTWDNETALKRNGVSGQSSVSITIKSLEKSDMQFTFTDNGDLWDFTFVKE